MWTNRVRLLRDVSGAAWLGERLAPSWRTVAGTVPTGFDAYARVLHPVDTGDGHQRWAHVAEVTGRQVHPAVQWHTLVGAPSPHAHGSDLWQDGEPEQGNLALEPLLALCEVLARHTTTPEDCSFALWEGWGQLHGARTRLGPDGGVALEPLLSPDELAVPRLRLPGRENLLFQGPLSAMRELVQYDGPEVWWTQSPALFWPADRSWCVATEIDLDSTLVGAGTDAVADVLGSPGLEALPIGLDASLQADGDHVNAS